MSRVAEKITHRIMNYLGENDPEKSKLKAAILAMGIRAAVKYLHYQSMKGIYEVRNPDKK